MTDSIADPPLRQLTRLRAEMGIATAQLTAAMFPDQPLLGVEYGVVARICLPDWTAGRSLARPESPGRAIPVRQMALSLGIATETARRHVNVLRDRGVFAISKHGVSIAATPANEALAMHYYLGVHDRFLRLIEDIMATCDVDFPVGETPAFGAADILERALDILLLPLDTFRLPGTNLLSFLLWAALTVVAVRDVTYDPVLSRRYANAVPPDDLRVGVSLRRLAAAMSVPYATAWRQVQELQEQGLVTRLGGDQWTVLTRTLEGENERGLIESPSLRLLRTVRELALLGLDPARVADHYRLGQPPRAELGLSGAGSRRE